MNTSKLLSIKLKSGEVLFAEELGEDDVSIEVLNPIQIGLVPERQADGSFHEYLSSKVWIPYTTDKYFVLSKIDIVHYGPLKQYYREYYLKTLVSQSSLDASREIVDSEEYETETECAEEFSRQVELLAERLGIENPDTEEPEYDNIKISFTDEHESSIVFDVHTTVQ